MRLIKNLVGIFPQTDAPDTDTKKRVPPPTTTSVKKEVQKLQELVQEVAVDTILHQEDASVDNGTPPDHLERMQALVDHSRTVLFRCHSLFPFDFFPDHLIIESRQINVKRRMFFYTSSLMSIPIKNIADVVVQTSPFFATIKIIDRSYTENSFTIGYLKRNDAKKARKIIQGLIIASKEGIDVGKIESTVLADLAEKLGHMYEIRE